MSEEISIEIKTESKSAKDFISGAVTHLQKSGASVTMSLIDPNKVRVEQIEVFGKDSTEETNLMNRILPQAHREMVVTVSKDELRQQILSLGYKTRQQEDGSIDLNPYVFDCALEMIKRGMKLAGVNVPEIQLID